MNNIQEILPLYFVAGTQDCRHLGDNPADNLLSVLRQALEGGITLSLIHISGVILSIMHDLEDAIIVRQS